MTQNDSSASEQDAIEQEQPFISHLLELRDRLLRIVVVVLLVFFVLYYFRNDLYHLLAEPLLAKLPKGGSLIATEPTGPFFAPLKLALALSVFLGMPYILYQAWAFVAPGLYRHERKLVVPLLISSVLLFYLGMAFAYFAVFPVVFGFFTSVAPEGVAVMTDISKYLDFVLKMFFAFGITFEVPIATIILVWMGLTTPAGLAAKRPYIIVGVFVVAAILTPPDVISQTMLAVPMWLLFEIGVFFSRLFVPKAEEDTAHEEYHPMSEAEMEAELDRAAQAETDLAAKSEPPTPGPGDDTPK